MWSDVPCIEWAKSRYPKGYGKLGIGSRTDGSRRTVYAHRQAWEDSFGPVPDGMHVLHHCDNPPCIEPTHLFLGTNADNVADRVAKGRSGPRDGTRSAMAIRNRAKTHCPAGHPYDKENTRVYRGGRTCRQCDRDRRQRRGHQQVEAPSGPGPGCHLRIGSG